MKLIRFFDVSYVSPIGVGARRGTFWFFLMMLAGCCLSARGQWQTQSVQIKTGWTAVYLHVDASYASLDQLVGGDVSNPIQQIWLWQAAAGSQQYVSSPQSPLNAGSPWVTWFNPSLGQSSTLGVLSPNSAYLIYSTANYTWNVKGKPTPPSYSWDISGLNLIGFPTPAANPPRFDAFLAPASALAGATVELYQYRGGALGPSNPSLVLSTHSTYVTRGQAFWMRATNAISSAVVNNTYFGPFQISLPNPSGISFGDSSGQLTFRIVNSTTNSITVTAKLLASEVAPSGQTAVGATPPLLMRGALNSTNLTYTANPLNAGGSQSWTLLPQGQTGSTAVVILGVNRYAMTNAAGSLYAGILQFTDSLGLSEVDVPVSAQAASTAGLWVGSASVSQVANYLKNYQTSSDGSMVVNSNGAYVVNSINTNLGAVAAPYPLRLIVHNDGVTSRLLQRVYYGLRLDTNLVVATTESVLDTTHLDSARRITASHLPWTATNTTWDLTGQLALGGVLSTASPIVVSYDDQATNPFLHTYHPDHDNLDAMFQNQLAQGSESYQISRQITLSVVPPGTDFSSLVSANSSLSGTYLETLTLGGLGGFSRSFNVSGAFTLNRISPIAKLTRQ